MLVSFPTCYDEDRDWMKRSKEVELSFVLIQFLLFLKSFDMYVFYVCLLMCDVKTMQAHLVRLSVLGVRNNFCTLRLKPPILEGSFL